MIIQPNFDFQSNGNTGDGGEAQRCGISAVASSHFVSRFKLIHSRLISISSTTQPVAATRQQDQQQKQHNRCRRRLDTVLLQEFHSIVTLPILSRALCCFLQQWFARFVFLFYVAAASSQSLRQVQVEQ